MPFLLHKDSYEVIDPPSPVEKYIMQIEQSVDELDQKIKEIEKNIEIIHGFSRYIMEKFLGDNRFDHQEGEPSVK